jgi:hypothetical protein
MDEKEYIMKKMELQERRKEYLLDISKKETQITLDNQEIIKIDWELTQLHELYKSSNE